MIQQITGKVVRCFFISSDQKFGLYRVRCKTNALVTVVVHDDVQPQPSSKYHDITGEFKTSGDHGRQFYVRRMSRTEK